MEQNLIIIPEAPKPKRFTIQSFIRKIRYIVALIRNTFVTDCPRCNQHFYGFHDWKQQVVFNFRNYRYVCHRCAEDHAMLDHKKAG